MPSLAALAFISMRVATGAIALITGTGSAGSFEPSEKVAIAFGWVAEGRPEHAPDEPWSTSSPHASASSTLARSPASAG